ncbi:MAG: outer membrane protein assembly factor BamB family protein, partial [Candidatus Helarchaeales archaeon]
MGRGINLQDKDIHDDKWLEGYARKASKNIEELWINYFQWPIPTPNGVAAGDVTGDGKLEVAACSDDHFLKLFSHDGREIWKKDLFDAVIFCKIADVDGDGKNEVICGGADKTFHVFDETGKEKWNKKIRKWFYCAEIADINDDGLPEVLTGTRDRNLYCLNGKNGEELWKVEADLYVKYCRVIKDYIIMGADDGTFRALNARGEERWLHEFEDRVTACGLALQQGAFISCAGCEDGTLKIFDEKGVESWSFSFRGPVSACEIVDFTQDGNVEIIACSKDAQLIVFNQKGKTILKILEPDEIT